MSGGRPRRWSWRAPWGSGGGWGGRAVVDAMAVDACDDPVVRVERVRDPVAGVEVPAVRLLPSHEPGRAPWRAQEVQEPWHRARVRADEEAPGVRVGALEAGVVGSVGLRVHDVLRVAGARVR